MGLARSTPSVGGQVQMNGTKMKMRIKRLRPGTFRPSTVASTHAATRWIGVHARKSDHAWIVASHGISAWVCLGYKASRPQKEHGGLTKTWYGLEAGVKEEEEHW
eukprot:CAMPEP_0119320202 /NCGR_PEP_ID=MMETSP1333-20130426/51827_1 /TAXON_ID=418940 /ORGANISM="Scyphosphaera apsteinii, Strain RCC1455" /LENGTH=104 /DNA_ID=CAMNT_0007326867 /DNA_START=225 /DNA_END=536 /DNA_ORIENTATION=+